MNVKNVISFALGLVVGAGLLFGFHHLARIENLFHNPEASMQARLSGQWQGTVEINGNDVPFSLVIKNDGKSLTGVLTAPQIGDVPCDQVTIDPVGNVSFTLHVDDKDATFAGKFVPDTHSMAGSLTSSIGSGDWSLSQKQS